MLPDFDWSDEEQVELSDAIRDALEATDAWQRYLDHAEAQGSAGQQEIFGSIGAWLMKAASKCHPDGLGGRAKCGKYSK